MTNRSPGRVFLVGAGPGDPSLLTLRGARCLAQADAVLYDYLVNPRILEHAPSSAMRLCLGRHGQGRLMSQAEVNARMVELAHAGHNVVRLKGGDPVVFARLAEEIEALAAAGVPYEVVPGITAALAAGSYASIPLTHRDHASAVALVAGQLQAEGGGPGLDFAALAAFPGTLVFYMGVTTAPAWTQALIAAGKSADTPVAIVRRCSWPDQETIHCTLGSVAQVIAARHVRPPVLTIVGDVTRHASEITWFTSRGLFGQRILVTRPRGQARELTTLLEDRGAECIEMPAIEIEPVTDWTQVDRCIARLGEFDWIVFSSSNGVQNFIDRLLATQGDIRRLGPAQLAAIGPGTAERLADYHLQVDLQPPEFRAESLAAALAPHAVGKRFLLIRASRGREVLAEQLAAAGGSAEQVVVYHSSDVPTADEAAGEQLRSGQIDWITVTSSAIARSLAAMFGADLARAKLASLSPVTSGVLRELGYEPAAEATIYTMPGLAAAIEAACLSLR